MHVVLLHGNGACRETINVYLKKVLRTLGLTGEHIRKLGTLDSEKLHKMAFSRGVKMM